MPFVSFAGNMDWIINKRYSIEKQVKKEKIYRFWDWDVCGFQR